MCRGLWRGGRRRGFKMEALSFKARYLTATSCREHAWLLLSWNGFTELCSQAETTKDAQC